MFITILRNGSRALLVSADTPLTNIPQDVRHWLGGVEASADAELDAKTPMLGLSAAAILNDITVSWILRAGCPQS